MMLNKLLKYFENSLSFPKRPERPSNEYYIFYNETENEWIGLLKSSVGEQELNLLKTLFTFVEYEPVPEHSLARKWYEFLLLDGAMPVQKSGTDYRFIQFHIHNNDTNRTEMEAALTGFFTEDVTIFWESNDKGIVIEEKTQTSLSEEELITMSETLESDFYVKISFYIGKQYPLSNQLPLQFRKEMEFFSFALAHINNTNIFTYERIFPAYIAYHLPNEISQLVNTEILKLFQQDHELFSTIKIFLENNLNASMTAKKLYIHRNTLQYRLDKFTEKTGIGLKDFYGAFTVFLACLVFEYREK